MHKENIAVSNDNVIGRLYNLISALKNTEDINSEEAFCKVFYLEQNNKASVLYNYSELFKMCTLGINEIQQLNPKNIQKYLDTLNSAIEGLSKIYFNASSNVLNNGLDKFKDYFDKTLMLSLEYCADYLSEHSKEVVIEDEKIQELIKEINELIESVLNSKLHNELERILIYHLNNIRESLLKYKLYGSQGIINSISTTLGTLILNREKVYADKDKTNVENIFKIVNKINGIVGFATKSVSLLSSIYKKITSDDE
ncbi:MAG TPA: hypothetical protein VIO64_21240 [Pseudobacteroides sp.]|uniref:hypothetical protein n=1 Tax=Pseudobacteroides sp. TaxID=1968840 RepID=UPI002F94D4BD